MGIKRYYLGLFFLLLLGKLSASEGMWMPDEKGCISNDLKEITVMFNDMCSGVILSSEGLLLTNHHCALEAIQFLSTPSRNYLKEGFIALSEKDEVPVPELNVKRLLYTRDITPTIDSATLNIEDEYSRLSIIESISRSICDTIEKDSPFISAIITPYYEGNRYFLNVYEVFRDIRLVLAPPHSIAAFGGETDNWMWPRTSADFALLRIYVSSSGNPAYYAPRNKPLKTDVYASISMKGYQQFDSVMTLGFPGNTQRYITSWEIESLKMNENIPRIEVREKKLDSWKKAMQNNPLTQIAYSSKYAGCSNFYKYSLGMNRCIDSLKIIQKRQNEENQFFEWIKQDTVKRKKYYDALMLIKNSIINSSEAKNAFSYVTEALIEGVEIINFTWSFMNIDLKRDKKTLSRFLKENATPFYEGYRKDVDQKLLIEMIQLVKERVPQKYLPSFYDTIRVNFNGEIEKYVEFVFDKSAFRSIHSLKKALQRKNKDVKIVDDPLYDLTLSLRMTYYDILSEMGSEEYAQTKGKRILFIGEKEYEKDSLYSNANFTMRKSFGIIKALNDENKYYTTQKDLLNKNASMKNEYYLDPSLKAIYKTIPKEEQMAFCFISDNDITGGNSGSPVFNAEGELIGLAFDGNWEGLAGDLVYDSEAQRAIHMDIRYLLFLVENWAKSSRIYREIINSSQ